MLSGYVKRLQIWETDFGRECGWVIERHGQPIAILSDPRNSSMFWDSYNLEIITDNMKMRQQMTSAEFWARAEAEGLIYRNRTFGDVAENAFPALSPFPEPGRLLMRALYLPVGRPKPWDRVVLWLRGSIRRDRPKGWHQARL